MYKKIFVILICMLFIGTSVLPLINGEKNDKKIPIEIGTVTQDGTLEAETFLLSEEQILEFETFFATITQKMESASSWEEIKVILDEVPDMSGLLIEIVNKIICKIKALINKIIIKMKFMFDHISAKINLYFNRGFVASFGHNYKLNPFKKSEIKSMKNFVIWRYSNKARLKDRTVIFKIIKDPLDAKIKILKGVQIGFMTNFIGLYVYYARGFPAHCTTFFLGLARYINGLQL